MGIPKERWRRTPAGRRGWPPRCRRPSGCAARPDAVAWPSSVCGWGPRSRPRQPRRHGPVGCRWPAWRCGRRFAMDDATRASCARWPHWERPRGTCRGTWSRWPDSRWPRNSWSRSKPSTTRPGVSTALDTCCCSSATARPTLRPWRSVCAKRAHNSSARTSSDSRRWSTRRTRRSLRPKPSSPCAPGSPPAPASTKRAAARCRPPRWASANCAPRRFASRLCGSGGNALRSACCACPWTCVRGRCWCCSTQAPCTTWGRAACTCAWPAASRSGAWPACAWTCTHWATACARATTKTT